MTLPDQSYIEISVRTDIHGQQAKKKIIRFFAACGIPAGQIVFFENPEDFRGAIYTREQVVLKRILSFPRKRESNFRLTSRLLTRKDWLDKWQEDYHIMPLGKKFMLVPYGQRGKFRAAARNRLPIYLDPKAAFGSGQHPSTQIMVQLMEDAAKSSSNAFVGDHGSVLDLGTGTGILSVAAHRLGAKKIRSYDFDAVAFQAAKFNLRLNGAKDFAVRRQNVTRLKGRRQFDLVLANLTPGVLMKAKRFVFSSVREGGFLMVSGILKREIEDFRRRFTHPHFRCLKVLKKGVWSGLSFSRAFR